MESRYRIQNENGTFLNAGTGKDSWFTLEEAASTVQPGQRVVEHDGMDVLWEVMVTPAYMMVPGEGAPQYTFDVPKDSQLSLF